MTITFLASGSEGNATLVRSGETRILVDCGLSVRDLTARMKQVGEDVNDITCVLCSHAHVDHAGGFARLLRHFAKRGCSIPIWATSLTAEVINWGGFEMPPVVKFEAGKALYFGEIKVRSLSVSHDCVEPLAFTFETNTMKFGMANDLGYVPDALRARFRGCDLVYIESNHDVSRLANGDYPLPLKERISGRNGHLSNSDAARFIEDDLDDSVRTLVLGHLSKANNNPRVCRESALEALKGRKVDLRIATQDEVLTIL